MAGIKETTPITPVLPPSTKNHIGRELRRPPQRDKDKEQHRRPKPDDDHHVDEYA